MLQYNMHMGEGEGFLLLSFCLTGAVWRRQWGWAAQSTQRQRQQSERSGNQSDASMHSDQEVNDHSEAEQHSGSERGHRDEDEDDEDRGRRSEGGSPAGSVMSRAGSPHSERASVRSDRRWRTGSLYWTDITWSKNNTSYCQRSRSSSLHVFSPMCLL